MEKNNVQNSMKNNNVQNNKNTFWKYLWRTIIILLVGYLALNYIAFNKIKISSKINKQTMIEETVSKLQKKYPSIMNIIASIDKEAKQRIIELVNKEIDRAYEPVYEHIDDFVDFHFSVTGEYTELATILFGKINNLLQEKVFKPANFSERLTQAQENIEKGVKAILGDSFDELKDKLRDEGFNSDEIDLLFNDILKLTKSQLQQRLENIEYNLLRGIGAGGSAVAVGALMAKQTSKVIAKKLTTKITTKLVAKTGGKLVLKAAGAGGGAVAGAEAGVICGPAAWICSPIGGVIGGIVGWLATDKIVVEIDKYFNKNEFRDELIKLINTQKQQTKEFYYKLFSLSFDKTSKELKDRFEALKNRPIIDNLK